MFSVGDDILEIAVSHSPTVLTIEKVKIEIMFQASWEKIAVNFLGSAEKYASSCLISRQNNGFSRKPMLNQE